MNRRYWPDVEFLGVIGYSSSKFDVVKAKEIISSFYDQFDDLVIVSGLTNLGIPAIAYAEAKKREWKTSGIACQKAKDFAVFPCDHIIMIGENWGDESEFFLSRIDMLLKVGGGTQSEAEYARALELEIECYEYKL